MDNKLLKELTDRTEFLSLLNKDITRNDALHENYTKELESLGNTVQHIKTLKRYPEQEALIPLAKYLYIPGKIIHTGEYHVTKKAHPNSYTMLLTAEQTISSLKNRIDEHEKVLSNIETAKQQLKDRKKILLGDFTLPTSSLNEMIIDDSGDLPVEDLSGMPKEIKSDKGVALKVGDFYEIVEFED